MKWYSKYLFLLMFLVGMGAKAQDYFPKNKEYNGKYYAIKSQKIKDRFGNEGDYMEYNSKIMDGKKVVVLLSCERCLPRIYKYSEKGSKRNKRAFFGNSTYKQMMVQYDEETFFIMTKADGKTQIDYYSKNKKKANAMTKAKAKELWRSIFAE